MCARRKNSVNPLAHQAVFASRDEEGTNMPILRRIWIRFQGASMGAYLLSVPIDATPKTDSKTSKIGIFVSSSSLSSGLDVGALYEHIVGIKRGYRENADSGFSKRLRDHEQNSCQVKFQRPDNHQGAPAAL